VLFRSGTMGEIKFVNWWARRIIDNFDLLADICIPGNLDLRTKWKNVAVEYRTTIKALQQKEDFSDAEIDNFQSQADSFFSKWLDLVGYDGITNYIHIQLSNYFVNSNTLIVF